VRFAVAALAATLAAALVLTAVPAPAAAQAEPPPLRIALENGSDAEQATAEQLRRIVREYQVPPGWILTDEILVDEGSIPHSHPVLTLHTRYLESDVGLLATFLHEQFHWLEDREEGFRAAMDDFAELFPDAPAGSPEGARDRRSTWRHLVVNDLELQAVSALVSEAEARRLLERKPYYTWIYRTVLEDPRVREVTRRHGMTVDALR